MLEALHGHSLALGKSPSVHAMWASTDAAIPQAAPTRLQCLGTDGQQGVKDGNGTEWGFEGRNLGQVLAPSSLGLCSFVKPVTFESLSSFADGYIERTGTAHSAP